MTTTQMAAIEAVYTPYDPVSPELSDVVAALVADNTPKPLILAAIESHGILPSHSERTFYAIMHGLPIAA